jgi:hypothetical protein
MTTTDIELYGTTYFENLNSVVTLLLEGRSDTQIAKELGMRRVDVKTYIEQFRQTAVAESYATEHVHEMLGQMDKHYDRLISESWKTLHEVDDQIALNGVTSQLLAQRTAATKLIGDLERQRIETFQKTGLLDAQDLGDQMAEIESRDDNIRAILREVIADCDKCRPEVMERLRKIYGEPEVVVVNTDSK